MKYMRHLLKLAHVRQMQGKTARRSGVYINVHEHSSTVLTTQLSTGVEFMKMSMKKIAFFILFLSLYTTGYATISPTPIATDPRIKTILYSPNEIIKYTGYYNFQSSLLFAEDEQIGTISLGFSGAWQMNPVGNRLFLKPVEQDATTNMTLITNKHTYFFELHAAEAKDISDKDISFEIRILYPSDETSGAAFHSLDRVPDLKDGDLNKYNLRYTVSGSDEITPVRIFDDGEFTYFQFKDINGEIPAFFLVNKEGDESIINYRTRGPYIVVERVAARYTLRQGKKVVCVFNEAMALGKPAVKPWYIRWFSSTPVSAASVPPVTNIPGTPSSSIQK